MDYGARLMEKDILQSIKLEISRNFRLMPYERIALHKVLGIVRSEQGMRILLQDLFRGPLIRESAIGVLKDFRSDEVMKVFRELLVADISIHEKLLILDHIEMFGSEQEIGLIIDLIKGEIGNEGEPQDISLLAKAFNVIRVIGAGSDEVYGFLRMNALNTTLPDRIRSLTLIGLSSFKDIALFETLLKEENNEISWAVYRSITLLCDNLMRTADESRTEEEQLYTYIPDKEDKVILDIRVLLGKKTADFEEYDNRVKTEFLAAMLSSNHREFIIYIMKALTSSSMELVERTLYLLFANVDRLRDPDKLFRNLISLSMDTQLQNNLIVEIFESYFVTIDESRKNLLLKDKIYNYIVVTLETFFETYRKEFMITNVAEKDFPENFRIIRRYILERLTPELKNRIVYYLQHEDRANIHKLMTAIADKIPFMEAEDADDFARLVEVLYDEDPKSRELSASRIDSIDFEKRYLRNRIVRLCELIGRLGIVNAAVTLVKILNYVKKYSDEHIFNAAAKCLSELNYSYMLGELELLLSAGGEEEHRMGVRFLSQFTDQRSLNILLEYLRERVGQGDDIVLSIMQIMITRDLAANMAANQVFKDVIQNNENAEIRRLAVLCIGRCGLEPDIEYLNSLFFSFADNPSKEAVVQAIGSIISVSTTINKRAVIGFLQEYLKDPGIRVRIYACSLLVSLGNRDALKIIRDMMIIKNKGIQRDILSILGNQKSTEIAYFLISLLREDYAISGDIVAVLGLMPPDDLREIDQFVVNIFKKYESPETDLLEQKRSQQMAEDDKAIKSLSTVTSTVLIVEIAGFADMLARMNLTDISMVTEKINALIISEFAATRGVVSSIGLGVVTGYYADAVNAAQAAMNIAARLRAYNETRAAVNRIHFKIQLMTGAQKLFRDELIFPPVEVFRMAASSRLTDRIIVDDPTRSLVLLNFYCEPVPDLVFKGLIAVSGYWEMVDRVNFLSTGESILNTFIKDEQERLKRQLQLDEELKKRKIVQRSPSALAYTQAIEDVGRKLKVDLNEISKYLERRVTDREVNANVSKMLNESYKRFMLEISKIVVD